MGNEWSADEGEISVTEIFIDLCGVPIEELQDWKVAHKKEQTKTESSHSVPRLECMISVRSFLLCTTRACYDWVPIAAVWWCASEGLLPTHLCILTQYLH